MREGRRRNRGVLRHVEVADVVQREGSGSCAGEARCGGISESRRPCVGGGFAVRKSRYHVSRVVCVRGVHMWWLYKALGCLRRTARCLEPAVTTAAHHRLAALASRRLA